MHENYDQVVHELRAIGCVFRTKDLPLKIDEGRKTCGKGGKYWYRLYTFAPRGSQRRFVVGSYGRYGKATFKVDWDREGLTAEQREQFRRDEAAARERDKHRERVEAEEAALSAIELWRRASPDGTSPYLAGKGVEPESCRFLPDGSVVVPLLRYDKPREESLRAVQRIYAGPRVDRRSGDPLPQKVFTKGFLKNGCSVRLGDVDVSTRVVMVCEGYATGLSIRMATGRRWPVYVALDAYNLGWVVEILRRMHAQQHLLICADDDWKTADHDGPNPGRNKARLAAKTTERCDIVWPVFAPATRQDKDTDFNDLHQREGLEAVSRQLVRVLEMIERGVRLGR